MEKVCQKCGENRSLDDFYCHPRMADGHLNFCKPCVLVRVTKHRAENIDRIQEYDRSRGLLIHRKVANKKRAPRYAETHKEALKRDAVQHPERYAARARVRRAIKAGTLKVMPCERCGFGIGVHAHHENYSKPLEVMWLCRFHHGERHREINAERRKAKAA